MQRNSQPFDSANANAEIEQDLQQYNNKQLVKLIREHLDKAGILLLKYRKGNLDYTQSKDVWDLLIKVDLHLEMAVNYHSKLSCSLTGTSQLVESLRQEIKDASQLHTNSVGHYGKINEARSRQNATNLFNR